MSHNGQMNDTIFRFPNGALAVIAGRPGTGKTALALQIAARNAKSGRSVLLFSLEMSEEQARKRMERQGFDAPAGRILIVDAPHVSVEEIAKTLDEVGGADAVVVDYLQLLQTEQGRAVTELKRLAEERNIPVILTSQLARSAEDGHFAIPDFAKDADIFLILRPDATDPRIADLIVAQNRCGETGIVPLSWDGDRLIFTVRQAFVVTLVETENAYKHTEYGGEVPFPEITSHRARVFGSFEAAKRYFRRAIVDLAAQGRFIMFVDGMYQPLAHRCRNDGWTPDHPAAKMATAAAKFLTDPDYETVLPYFCRDEYDDTILCDGGRLFYADVMDTELDTNALSMTDPDKAYFFHYIELESRAGYEAHLLLQKVWVEANDD